MSFEFTLPVDIMKVRFIRIDFNIIFEVFITDEEALLNLIPSFKKNNRTLLISLTTLPRYYNNKGSLDLELGRRIFTSRHQA